MIERVLRMRKVRMNVQGRVQGVGFRYTTKMLADRLGVTGKVWNEADGSVGIEAIGDGQMIEEFIKEVKASPSPAGHVQQALVVDDPMIEERNSFDVVFSY